MSELKVMSYALLAGDPGSVSRPLAEDVELAKVLGSLIFHLSLSHTNRRRLRLVARMSDGSFRPHTLRAFGGYAELLGWADEVLQQSDWTPNSHDVAIPAPADETPAVAA